MVFIHHNNFLTIVITIIVQIGQYVSGFFIFGFTAVAILDIIGLILTFDALYELLSALEPL